MSSIEDITPPAPLRRTLSWPHRRVREVLSWVTWLMALGHNFGRWLLQTEYVVEGRCEVRGDCCHHILMEWSPLLDRSPLLRRFALWKLTRFYSFYDKGYSWEVQEGLLVRVLGCRALGDDGRCREYRIRPLFCRTYPHVPLTGRPLVLRGCGYAFRRRDGAPEPDASPLVQIGGRGSSVYPPKSSSSLDFDGDELDGREASDAESGTIS